MPQATIGEPIAIDRRTDFLELKAKGEKIVFRLVASGVYDGKHFLQDGDRWQVTYCPRIMEKATCEKCEKYFELADALKELKESKAPADEIKEMEKTVRKFRPTIRFYYPVVNRDTHKAGILKTSLSVRLKIEDYFNAGVDVFGSDFVLTRTEKPGADYYALIRKDSKDAEDLTEEEQAESMKATAWNLETMVISKKSNETFKEEA